MKKIQFKIILQFVALILIFTNCKKDNRVLDTSVTPIEDGLTPEFADTFKINAFTIESESIASYNTRYKFLGANQDPTFGRTDINLYLNPNIKDNVTNTIIGTNPTLISSEIILKADNIQFTGDTTTKMTYSVFETNTKLDNATVYYSNKGDSLVNKSKLIGKYTGKLSFLNNSKVLRIPIDSTYASSILTNTTLVQSNDNFQTTIKGFYITASGSNINPVNLEGIIYKFDLEDTTSGFYLRYVNGPASPTNTLINTYKFVYYGSTAARFNVSSYSAVSGGNSLLIKQLFNKDSIIAPKTNLFIKGFASTKIKIKIPSLKNLADSHKVSINRAEIAFKIDPSFATSGGTKQYAVPSGLSLLALDSLGKTTYLVDQTTNGDLNRYGGYFDATTNSYVFNIMRHVQQIVNGTRKNYGFMLLVTDPNPLILNTRDNFIERAVFAGTEHPTLQPKISISYIKFRNN